MEDITRKDIEYVLQQQRAFFATHQTKNCAFRVEALKKLKNAIIKYESKIADALSKDLRKSFEEAYLTEISIVLEEITNHIKNIGYWSSPKGVSTPFYLFPSSSKIQYEPLGVALVIAPWNYPFQLLMNPLVGAISAGCCAILKPSPHAPHTAKVMEDLLKEIFPANYVAVVQGGREVNEMLLEQKFDTIFFTGSSAVGKVVMKAAAQHLTPVVLELGGKSPCIVDKEANIDLAAKRIIWGKTINAGQSCIAPDYVFVHQSVKEELVKKMVEHIHKMFGKNIQESKHYPRIVTVEAFDRIEKLITQGTILFGGRTDRNDKFIEPTLLDNCKPESPIMQEEIFGPVLPILAFENISEVVTYINSKEKPLALYYFGATKKANEVLSKTTAGGVCINDTMMHIANHHLPFGGVGNSGLNKYHGKESFLAFSNAKGIVSTPTWIDLPFKYVPFKFFKLLKKFI
ncbi:MAG: aldehyde dehydrogenase [Bacteroidetes bacterium]|nr:aldehyde dehydrogenase [Bacteroidota bacterium]